MTINKALLEEVIATIAGHYGATTQEVRMAYAARIGSVRKEVQELYAKTYTLLMADIEAAQVAQAA